MRNMEHVMTVKYLGESVPLQQTYSHGKGSIVRFH